MLSSRRINRIVADIRAVAVWVASDALVGRDHYAPRGMRLAERVLRKADVTALSELIATVLAVAAYRIDRYEIASLEPERSIYRAAERLDEDLDVIEEYQSQIRARLGAA